MINNAKSLYCVDSIEFLGCQLSIDGHYPKQLNPFNSAPLPPSKADMRRILACFCCNCSSFVSVFTGGSFFVSVWKTEGFRAIEMCSSQTPFSAFSNTDPAICVIVTMDASEAGTEAALSQVQDRIEKPTYFISCM